MIAVDTNLLLYAHREDSPFHEAALRSIIGLAESGQRWSIPWPCLHEFFAISTHPRIFDPPTPLETALKTMEVWIMSGYCEMIGEGPGYLEVLNELLVRGKIEGSMVHDGRVAAICLYHGVRVLWTADRDFSRFPALKTHNPMG